MKKTISLVGMIVGFAFVVVGILAMSGTFGCDVMSHASSAPSAYDSGYASFGADYYSYSVNNGAEAAVGARVAANNLADIGEFISMFSGVMSMLIGFAVICGFGVVFASCKATPVDVAAVNEYATYSEAITDTEETSAE